MNPEIPIPAENRTPGTVWDLGDGEKIVFGEMKITYAHEGSKLVCHIDQEYKFVYEEWVARVVE